MSGRSSADGMERPPPLNGCRVGMRKGQLMRHALAYGMIAAALLFAAPAVAQQEVDTRLRSAGFKIRLASTPPEIALLRRVSPRIMLTRTDQARRYYVYADPDYCKCVYVGDEVALRTYREMEFSPKPPPAT